MRTAGLSRAALAALVLTGCATPITVVGHLGSYDEVFRGTGANTGTSSQWEAVLEPSKVRCTASAELIALSRWSNRIVCTDGRTGTVETALVDGGLSEGTGRLSDGTAITLVRGVDGRPAGYYERFLQAHRQLGGATPSSGGPAVEQRAADEPVAAQEALMAREARARALGAYTAHVEEAAKAEEVGHVRDAVTSYVAALGVAADAGMEEGPLRERIIELVGSLTPSPAIPEEARRHAIRGQTLLTAATSRNDYLQAAREFERALLAAPWWGDIYYNLALAQDGADEPTAAVANLRLFLLTGPEASLARQTRDQLYALEARAERAVQTQRWLGEWRTATGSTLRMRLTDDEYVLYQVTTSATAQKGGWSVGDIVFRGQPEGDTLSGAYFPRQCVGTGNDAVCARCFGTVQRALATATLSPDGQQFTIAAQHERFRYNLSTCVKTSQSLAPITSTYTRVE
jgi:tetratricopeptide (TPR) repeat protein